MFSKKQFTKQDDLKIQYAIENWPYTCRSAQEHNLFNKVFIREKICCKIPMEFTYYSWQKVHSDRCYYCGSTENLQDKSNLLMETYKSVLPLCAIC